MTELVHDILILNLVVIIFQPPFVLVRDDSFIYVGRSNHSILGYFSSVLILRPGVDLSFLDLLFCRLERVAQHLLI